jgi:hypothetical protein
MRRVTHDRILATGAFALSLFGVAALPAKAADAEISTGHILVCDTPEEVSAVLESKEKDIAERLTMANARYGKEACNVVTVAFVRGEEAKTVLVPDGVVRIVKVTVVGVQKGNAWMRMDTPMDQYAGILEAALGV